MSAAEVLAQHQGPIMTGLTTAECYCRKQYDGLTGKADQHAAHQLDALKAAGYVVIELADEDTVADYGLYATQSDNFGMPVGEEHNQGTRFRSIDETRCYAAALLAVAAAAEADR